jgi:hypothetical protein
MLNLQEQLPEDFTTIIPLPKKMCYNKSIGFLQEVLAIFQQIEYQ